MAETELTSAPHPVIDDEYIWFDGIPVAQQSSTGETRWTFTDHLGTPILQTSSLQGVVWRAEYEPYGRVFELRAQDVHQPLRLPGQEAEQLNAGANGATNRSYNIHRWYENGVGRYAEPDPLGVGRSAMEFNESVPRTAAVSGQIRGTSAALAFDAVAATWTGLNPRSAIGTETNLYRYVMADPASFVDPLGLACGSGFTDPLVPDRIPGAFDFTSSCRKHDSCYDTCGVDKSICDQTFLMNMIDQCDQRPWIERRTCKNYADLYYEAVKWLGEKPFEGGQRNHCSSFIKETAPGVFSVEFPQEGNPPPTTDSGEH